LAVQKKYTIKPEHKEIIDKRLGSYWKPIPTLKA
jgi:hypothetical protein